MSSPSVLWVLPNGGGDVSPLAERLAQDHRIIRLAASKANTQALSGIHPPVGEFVLIGQSSCAQAALALARDAGPACAALILIAPLLVPLPPADTAPDLPTLMLVGMDDTRVPPSATAALCAALPRAHPILIYGAGHALDRERVEAVVVVMRDFIARGDQFIVRAASNLLYP